MYLEDILLLAECSFEGEWEGQVNTCLYGKQCENVTLTVLNEPPWSPGGLAFITVAVQAVQTLGLGDAEQGSGELSRTVLLLRRLNTLERWKECTDYELP